MNTKRMNKAVALLLFGLMAIMAVAELLVPDYLFASEAQQVSEKASVQCDDSFMKNSSDEFIADREGATPHSPDYGIVLRQWSVLNLLLAVVTACMCVSMIIRKKGEFTYRKTSSLLLSIALSCLVVVLFFGFNDFSNRMTFADPSTVIFFSITLLQFINLINGRREYD